MMAWAQVKTHRNENESIDPSRFGEALNPKEFMMGVHMGAYMVKQTHIHTRPTFKDTM